MQTSVVENPFRLRAVETLLFLLIQMIAARSIVADNSSQICFHDQGINCPAVAPVVSGARLLGVETGAAIKRDCDRVVGGNLKETTRRTLPLRVPECAFEQAPAKAPSAKGRGNGQGQDLGLVNDGPHQNESPKRRRVADQSRDARLRQQ